MKVQQQSENYPRNDTHKKHNKQGVNDRKDIEKLSTICRIII